MPKQPKTIFKNARDRALKRLDIRLDDPGSTNKDTLTDLQIIDLTDVLISRVETANGTGKDDEGTQTGSGTDSETQG